MSGGVDSSVAAALLVDQGYEVTGVIMKIWDDSLPAGISGAHACFGPDEKEDVEKAREVCERLGIDLLEIDLKDEYRHTVLEYFASEYACGRTPNPCVKCNSKMKFGAMVDRVRELGIEFDHFATGHYVRNLHSPVYGSKMLCRASDARKDQSYFLYRLTREQLETALFPLGGMEKEQVKQLAIEKQLGFESIPESQDFIAGDYSILLEQPIPGKIVDAEGTILGSHEGIENYTIGQRRGLGISSDRPLYVMRLDSETHEVVVGFDSQLYAQEFFADSVSFLVPDEAALFEGGELFCTIKIRSQQEDVPAAVRRAEDGSLSIHVEEPLRAIAPGQSVVLYDGEIVLGGGIIRS